MKDQTHGRSCVQRFEFVNLIWRGMFWILIESVSCPKTRLCSRTLRIQMRCQRILHVRLRLKTTASLTGEQNSTSPLPCPIDTSQLHNFSNFPQDFPTSFAELKIIYVGTVAQDHILVIFTSYPFTRLLDILRASISMLQEMLNH